MSSNKDFTVLISIYYKEKPQYFKECLKSIFDQSILPTEVVLVEDGQLTDELYAVIAEFSKKYSQLKSIKLEKNGGLGKALNEGLKHCSYDIIARMDTDDISVPDRFEKQLRIFEMYPQVDVVSSWIDEFEGVPENIISTRKLPEYPYQIYEYAKNRCPINHPAAMFRKNAVLLAGGYKPFPLFEDYYLWIRLLLNGAKFYNIQESLLKFRTSEDMYKRRGGLKHALTEVRFQNHVRKMGFWSYAQFFKNVSLRFPTRLLPNVLREKIYKTFLRK